jgi:hypothetical protein
MEGNSELSLKFLKDYKPGGPWVLGSIAVDRKQVDFGTFNNEASALEFINKYNGNANLYFLLNDTARILSTKP